ncbi:MAG: hypothetical protein LKJ57_06995, partial [Ancrocorticia sp.]|nr:hypothetical protein [Ancrocorticia sp.]
MPDAAEDDSVDDAAGVGLAAAEALAVGEALAVAAAEALAVGEALAVAVGVRLVVGEALAVAEVDVAAEGDWLAE